jgi:hypothetical protein
MSSNNPEIPTYHRTNLSIIVILQPCQMLLVSSQQRPIHVLHGKLLQTTHF